MTCGPPERAVNGWFDGFAYPGESDSVGGGHAAEWEPLYLSRLRRDCVELNESILVALWPRRSL